MTLRDEPTALCRNEGCPRPAEPGEGYCAACGLERSLFRRDDRDRGFGIRDETKPVSARR